MIYHLKHFQVIILFCIYVVLVLGGCGTNILVLLQPLESLEKSEIIRYTILSSLTISLTTCALQYIRRLYKACIEERIDTIACPIRSTGNIMYFLSRPLFSLVFSLLFIISVLAGYLVIGGTLDVIINENFLYMCVIISSFIGFSVGKVLDYYKSISENTVSKMRGVKNEREDFKK